MAYKPDEIEATFNKIILEMISGRSLRSILADNDMPSINTFYKWIEEDESKMKHYARATTIRADFLFEEIIEISDDSSKDTLVTDLGDGVTSERMNAEFVQRSRLRVDARKWVVSKLNPKKYGDKIENTHIIETPIFTGIDLDVPTDNSTE
jgi:hypothetical protein